MRRTKVAVCLALSLLGSVGFARRGLCTELFWSGQVRLRAEGFDRTLRAGANEIDVFERSRIGLRAVADDGVEAFFEIQDSRVFGMVATLGDDRNLGVHQAYGQIAHKWNGTALRARAGRQELSYGNERILGAVGWSNVGRAFDALQLRVQVERWSSDLVVARLQDASITFEPNDDDLFLNHHRFEVRSDLAAEAYVLHRDDESGRFETTLGEHVADTQGRVQFDQEFAYQLGSVHGMDLSAFLGSVQAHVQVAERGKPSLGVGCDIVSGDDPDDADLQLFDVRRIFHTGHKFYGILDVATELAGNAGLIDPYIIVRGQPTGKVQAEVATHLFLVHQSENFTVPVSGGGTEPESDSYFGTEIDAVASWEVRPQVKIEIGGALLFPGAVLDHQGRDNTAGWGYAQSLIRF